MIIVIITSIWWGECHDQALSPPPTSVSLSMLPDFTGGALPLSLPLAAAFPFSIGGPKILILTLMIRYDDVQNMSNNDRTSWWLWSQRWCGCLSVYLSHLQESLLQAFASASWHRWWLRMTKRTLTNQQALRKYGNITKSALNNEF